MRIEKVEGEPDTGRERILAQLSAHAEAVGHPFSSETGLFEAWDGESWLGGLHCRFGAEWTFVDLLAVSDEARGRGVGRRLLEELEREAVDRGMAGIWLDTYTFQAPEFYRKMGFVEFGRIPDYPRGHARVFFAKRLAAG